MTQLLRRFNKDFFELLLLGSIGLHGRGWGDGLLVGGRGGGAVGLGLDLLGVGYVAMMVIQMEILIILVILVVNLLMVY